MQVSWSTQWISTFKLNLNSKLVSFFDHSNQPLDFTFSYCHCLSCQEDEKYAGKHSDDVHCRTYSYLFLYKAGSGNYNWQASETWLGALIFTVIIYSAWSSKLSLEVVVVGNTIAIVIHVHVVHDPISVIVFVSVQDTVPIIIIVLWDLLDAIAITIESLQSNVANKSCLKYW